MDEFERVDVDGTEHQRRVGASKTICGRDAVEAKVLNLTEPGPALGCTPCLVAVSSDAGW